MKQRLAFADRDNLVRRRERQKVVKAPDAAERERFSRALRDAGWDPQPSTTNFLLVAFAGMGAAESAAEGLLSRGLIPRTFPAEHPLAHCLRLTVRNQEQDDRLVAAAREIGTGR